MSRTTNSVARHKRKKRLLKAAKGYWGDRKNHLRVTKNAVQRALMYNYIHRKQKKRNFRCLWISRIGAASKANGISYSKLIHGLQRANCLLDRKMLADLAATDPKGFEAVVSSAREALA